MIRVLIIDDEYIMRQGLKYMINWEQEGFEIVGEASNGKDALELIDELKPHIVISDIVMPLLDGVDFTEAMHKLYPHIQIIILSGYDNFEYVKYTFMNGVVDYVLKPTLNPEELRKILKKAAERIPGYKLQKNAGTVSYERMMERYLLGHDSSLDTVSFSKYFSGDYFRIYAMYMKREDERGQDMSDVLYKKIEREMKTLANIQSLTVTIREEIVCVILNYNLSQRGQVLSVIEELNKQLVFLCSRTFSVLSSPFMKLEDTNKMYQNCIVKNVDKAFYYRDRKLLIADEESKEENRKQAGKFDFFRYNQLLSGKQFPEAMELLVKYSEEALNGQTEEYRLKNQMKNMLYHFLDFLQLEEEERENYRYAFFGEIDGSVYEEDYRQSFLNITGQLKEVYEQHHPQTDERIKKMLDYIDRNYKEDLKLEDLATEFNFNYHYLSAYFNRQMREGFSGYLNRVRTDKACCLLKEKEMTIAQISSEVGYSDHSYFCRVFKKIMGTSPSEWRREQAHE